MSDFDDLINDIDADIVSIFGEKAIHNGSTALDVVIDRNVERSNNYGEIVVNKIEITFQKACIPTVKDGDTFQTNDDTYTVDDTVVDDRFLVTVSTR